MLIFKSEFDLTFFSSKIIFCGLIMGAGFQESSVPQSDFSVAVPKMVPNPISKIDFSGKIELKMKISKFRYSIS